MTTKTTTTTTTVSERADSFASERGGPNIAGLSSLLSEASGIEAEYVLSLLTDAEQNATDDSMLRRLTIAGAIGDSIVKVTRNRFNTGAVKDSEGKPIGPLSSDETPTMAQVKTALGIGDKGSRFTLGNGRSLAATDVQRYWYVARASVADRERGVAEGSGDFSKTVAAIARATFERTDPAEAAKRAARTADATAAREAKRAAEKAEAEALKVISPTLSPVVVDPTWSLDQVRAAVMVLQVRAGEIRAEQVKADAAARKLDDAVATMAAATGRTLDEVRAMLAPADAPVPAES